jgi:hypothetical protein
MALDLLALIRLGRIEPCSVSRLFIEPLAEIERTMAKRDEGFRRLNPCQRRSHFASSSHRENASRLNKGMHRPEASVPRHIIRQERARFHRGGGARLSVDGGARRKALAQAPGAARCRRAAHRRRTRLCAALPIRIERLRPSGNSTTTKAGPRPERSDKTANC